MAKFKIKPYQYHAQDLFNIEKLILDLAEHARHLIPNLAPLVGLGVNIKPKKQFLGRPPKITNLDLDAPIFFQPGRLNKFLTQF